MDAVKFLKEWNRMCKAGGTGCFCDLNPASEGDYCDTYAMEHPEEAVAIVEKWTAEHPKKTRQSEFREKYPYARLDECGVLYLNPCDINTIYNPRRGCAIPCDECRKEYWNEEVDDDE